MRRIDDINFVVFDIETGGLDEDKHPIIELAFITLQKDKKGDLVISKDLTFDCLIKPYSENLTIEEQALKVNGITFEEIEKFGVESKDVVEGLIELSQSLQKESVRNRRRGNKPLLVGHNIDDFDVPFLRKFFELHNKNLYDYFSFATVDTYTLSRILFRTDQKIDNLKLITVCNYFGIRINNAHRAYEDAMANAELFIKMDKLLNLKRKEINQL